VEFEVLDSDSELDELLRALPGADASLMMLEEAPKEVMRDVEEEQRDVRSSSSDTDPDVLGVRK
jgi:hypothetical protein